MAGGDSKRIPIPTQRNDLRSDGNLPLCVSTLFLLLIKCDLCLQGRCKARATAGRRRYEQWESFCFSFACKFFRAFTPPQLYIVLFFVLVCATEW